LFNGAIHSAEHVHIAQLLRRKSKLLVAFGSCACEGCIPALINLSSKTEFFDTVFSTKSTDNPNNIRPQTSVKMPEGVITIPEMYSVVRTLDQVVPVDYFMPGCPPESHQIAAVIDLVIQVLEGKAELPPPGSVIGAGESTVCDDCPRKRNVKKIKKFDRIQFIEPDPELCLLEQGILCSGPATRNGCKAKCPSAGSPCIGCYGPAEGVMDYGARLMTAIASLIDSNNPDEIDQILDGMPDPAGQLYRFNMAGSLLQASKAAWQGK
jgi:F420-non-reducing hydrogenase small subunit